MERLDRRQMIIHAAYRLIADAGFEGFRVRTVAQHAGINHATLLHYYPSKEAVVEAVVEHMLGQLQQEGQRHEELPAIDLLCQEFTDLKNRIKAEPAFFLVLNELQLRAQRDPLVALPMQRMDHAWHHYLRKLIEKGINKGELRSDLVVEAAVEVLMVQFRGFGLRAMGVRDARMLDEMVEMACTMVRRWLQA